MLSNLSNLLQNTSTVLSQNTGIVDTSLTSLVIGIGSFFTGIISVYIGWVRIKKIKSKEIKSFFDTLTSPSNSCIHLNEKNIKNNSFKLVLEKNIVSLANLGEGKLILKKGRKKDFEKIIKDIAKSTDPPIDCVFIEHDIENIKVLEITIKSNNFHCTSSGQFFLRKDNSTILAGKDEILFKVEEEIVKRQPVFELAKIAEEYIKIKNAFISVSDKTDLVELSKKLIEQGIQIWATEGTRRELEQNNVEVNSISEMTRFNGLLGNRVKSVHPRLIASILADKENNTELKELEENNIPLIDLVIINLYPFEEVVVEKGISTEALLENIDIGGAILIRTAIRNVKRVTVVTHPQYYESLINDLKSNGKISFENRVKFAKASWKYLLIYDRLISQFLDRLKVGSIK